MTPEIEYLTTVLFLNLVDHDKLPPAVKRELSRRGCLCADSAFNLDAACGAIKS